MRQLFAAFLVLAVTPVHAQTVGQSVCQAVWNWETGRYDRVCNWVSSPTAATPAPAAATTPTPQEPDVRRGPGTVETIQVVIPPHGQKAPTGRPSLHSDLCPPPYHMTEMDGCQR